MLGGTFDPIHEAHLAIAREAARRFHLDEVLFIPASNPPHKRERNGAGYEDRYRMVELACQGHEGFAPSRIEEGQQRSYSITTIERLKRERPGDRFFFLIGADAFADIETWHRWRDVIAAVDFIVVTRPGHAYDVPAGAVVHGLDTVSMEVSSSAIREAIAAGKIPVGLPPAVYRYAVEHRLYSGRPVSRANPA
ncbi:MAG: nicotinate-nucleotide adenylyltransferase [Bryobacteraceae bacterium]